MNVGQLREIIENLPSDTWLCVKNGLVDDVIIELGANEPFILLVSDNVTSNIPDA